MMSLPGAGVLSGLFSSAGPEIDIPLKRWSQKHADRAVRAPFLNRPWPDTIEGLFDLQPVESLQHTDGLWSILKKSSQRFCPCFGPPLGLPSIQRPKACMPMLRRFASF